MSKKMLKRSLALGALMAFVITGQAWAAEIEVDVTKTYTSTITGSDFISNFYINDTNDTISLKNGNSLIVTNTAVNNTNRNYGFLADNGGNLTVNGNIDLTVANSVSDRAVRIYGNSKMKFDGDLSIDVNSDEFTGNCSIGIDLKNSSVQVTGDTDIDVVASDWIYGVYTRADSEANFDGDLTINATLEKDYDTHDSNDYEPMYAVYNNNSSLVVDGDLLVEVDDKADGRTDALLVVNVGDNEQDKNSYSEATFNGDVTITYRKTSDDNSNVSTVGIVSGLESCIGDVKLGSEEVATTTKIDIKTFNNESVDETDVTVYALSSASSANVVGTSKNNVDIDVLTKSSNNAYGIIAYNPHNTAGSVTLLGSNDVRVDNLGTGNAYGVYGSSGADIDLADATITASSVEGKASGIYVIGNSDVDVTGIANIYSTAKTLAEGLQIENSSITFSKDVLIDVEATSGDVYAARIVSNPDKPSTAVFNGNLTINADATGNAWGLYASGSNSTYANVLNGKEVQITVNADGQATGIAASYNGTVSSSENTNVVISATSRAGEALGIFNTYVGNESQGNANINLNGNVEVIAKGAQGSYSIYNFGSQCGSTTVGGINKKVVLEGDIVADSGLVSSTFGTADSKFEGKVTTANVANTTLKFNAGTWNLTGASTVSDVTFAAGSTLVIEGKTFDAKEGSTDYALNGVGSDSKLTVKDGAKLTVTGIKETTYNIAKGFNTLEGTKVDETTTKYWDVNDVNTLMQGVLWNNGENGLQLEVYAKPADTLSEEMNVSESTAQSLASVTEAARVAEKEGAKPDVNGTGDDKAVAFINAMSGVDSKVAGQVYEAVSKMAEAGGNSATAASIVKNVTGVTNDRLSFNCGHSAPHKGGHGVGLFEEGSGADIWVEYVHGKDKVEDMPSTAGTTSYEGQYNGIVMGVDFKKVNKFQSGIAFNYGEGDTNSVGSAARTHSDYDFWGIGYYGNIHNDDSNVIFDIGYAKTDSDVENTNATGVNFKASPETTTWTAGVKLEKLYQNENVQIVPYTGLRFMSIDPKDYSTECASTKYQMERQNVWLLPLGVSIRQEIANDNGWTVSPRVDLSYIWAFGDTDSEMEFSTLGTKTNIGYEVMDDGSVLGLVGIEAHKGQWGFGVSYSYQKGDHSESKKWFIDANYSF